MSYANTNSQDESNSPVSVAFAAACNDPAGFDFSFVEERLDANFANFGVDEQRHREIFAEHGVPYPGDEDEGILLESEL